MTEVDVLRRVWGRIQSEADPETKRNMVDMLRQRLSECGKEISCASGRVARIVDSLTTFDTNVNLRPLWAVRQEMLAKAAVLREQVPPAKLQDTLRATFRTEYVDKGILTLDLLDAELESWGPLD
jgi:hypothetical protein